MGELSLFNYDTKQISLYSKEVLENPLLFNSKVINFSTKSLSISKASYSEYSDSFGSVKSFRKIEIDKSKSSGLVKTNIRTLSISKSNETNYLTLRNLDLTRLDVKTSKSINSIKIRIDKTKESCLPLLVSTLLDRNLL
tara:strand:+ start:75 stop:491 length:417 start_codon:yes stop_codon:yes gene_type:complete